MERRTLQLKWTRLSTFGIIPTVLVIATILMIFSFEFPVLQGISTYASINTEDLSVLSVVTVFVLIRLYSKSYTAPITLRHTTALVVLLSGWIALTVAVAYVRSPEPITASALWMLKWFEGVGLFITLQGLVTRKSGTAILQTIIIGASAIGVYAIFLTIQGQYRARLFFNNPNALAAFLLLAAMLAATRAIVTHSKVSLFYMSAAFITSAGVLATGSRSGVIALLAGYAMILYFLRRWLKLRHYVAVVGTLALTPLLSRFILIEETRSRLISLIPFILGKKTTLGGSIGVESLMTRLEAIRRTANLFVQQPIFGYGWFAVPSRIPFLDIYYPTILIDIGIVGFVLMMILSLYIIRIFFSMQRPEAVAPGIAGAAWYLSLLIQGIGGAFPRTPHFMFITFVMLASVTAIGRDIEFDDLL